MQPGKRFRLTASDEVCRQADLIRGIRAFFIDG